MWAEVVQAFGQHKGRRALSGDTSDCFLESVGEDLTGQEPPSGPPDDGGEADGKGPI